MAGQIGTDADIVGEAHVGQVEQGFRRSDSTAETRWTQRGRAGNELRAAFRSAQSLLSSLPGSAFALSPFKSASPTNPRGRVA
jgi:hypothetical protein